MCGIVGVLITWWLNQQNELNPEDLALIEIFGSSRAFRMLIAVGTSDFEILVD